MRQVPLLIAIPAIILAVPFGLVGLWRLLERGYTAMFISLSMGDDFTQRTGPDILALGSILLAAAVMPLIIFEVNEALAQRRQQNDCLRQREAELRWHIERQLERKYAEAMRDFVREQKTLEPLTSNRAPVVVEQ